MEEMQQLSIGEPEFFDLNNPGCTPHAEGARPAWGLASLVGRGGGQKNT